MAKRGPKPTPTAILAMRGSWLANARPLEPKTEPGEPAIPFWLGLKSSDIWRRLVPGLVLRQILTPLDGPMLAMLCDAIVDYVAARKMVEQEGMVTIGRQDQTIVHPAVKIMQDAWERTVKALREFGLSPSALWSLKVRPPEADEKREAFFNIG